MVIVVATSSAYVTIPAFDLLPQTWRIQDNDGNAGVSRYHSISHRCPAVTVNLPTLVRRRLNRQKSFPLLLLQPRAAPIQDEAMEHLQEFTHDAKIAYGGLYCILQYVQGC